MSTVEEKVFDRYKKITELAQSGNNTKIALGELLLWMREADRYKFIAGEESTWTSFLASPEINIPYSSAMRYMSIAQTYIKDLELKYEDLTGLDTWGLYYVAHSKIINKRNAKRWLANIRELSRSDLMQIVKFPDKDVMKCKHTDCEEIPPKRRCKNCGAVMNKR